METFTTQSRKSFDGNSKKPKGNIAKSSVPRHSFISGEKLIQRKASCSCGGGCPACKSNSVNVSMPHDPAEIEADRVADRVMQKPDREAGYQASLSGPGLFQRKARKTVGKDLVNSAFGSSTSSGEQPLDRRTREFFEPRFGHDLSMVKVQTGSEANRSARALDARAYTQRSTVTFADGEYSPETESGKHLLAHELAHVIQQRKGAVADAHTIQRQTNKDALRKRLAKIQRRMRVLRRKQERLTGKFVTSTTNERQAESHKKMTESLKKQVRSASVDRQLWGGRFARERFLKAATLTQSGNKAIITAQFQLSYKALSKKNALARSAIDSPRIEAAIRDVFQVKISTGDYAGISFQLNPNVTFLPPGQKRSDDSFLIEVRGKDKGPSSGDSVSGKISLAAVHLKGDRVIVVAHELAHLFGFIDTYIKMTHAPDKKTGVRRVERGVGRVRNTPDLLGTIDPFLLKKYLRKGEITKEDFKQQSGKVNIWDEEASIVLGAFGAKPLPPKPKDPASVDFDAAVELENIRRRSEKKLSNIREKRMRTDNSIEWLKLVEETMKLEKQESSLKKQLGSSP